MRPFVPFDMERWQSTYENRVEINLSESGVDPLTVRELRELAGHDIDDIPIGYGQSNGSDALRANIARLYGNAAEDGIVVCNGSAEANFLAVWELVRPDDEIAVLVPTYMQTHGLARNIGARIVEVPLREEYGWQPDPAEIRRAITERTRLVVVTNPGNPTGVILHEEARRALIETSSRTGTWILADEVYTGAELSGIETPSFHGTTERVIATGSLSKAYGLPGLRVGWAATDPTTAARLWARSDYTTISPGELTDRLATMALESDVRPKLQARTRQIIRGGLHTLTYWMQEQGGLHGRAPDAGAISLVRYDADIESGDLAEMLRLEESVLIVPGVHFGLGRHMRLSLGMPQSSMQEGLRRIGRVLSGRRH